MNKKSKKLIIPKNVKIKLLVFNDYPTFSLGVIRLLVKIHELGSLNKACKELDMGYSKGLRIIRRAEDDLGFKLIEGKIGGSGGGGSTLTKQAILFIEFYNELYQKLNDCAEKYISKYR